MGSIKQNILDIEKDLVGTACRLIIVTKTKPIEKVFELYHLGYRAFGENRVQELILKHEALPKDIEWHLIGHLQTNKVKSIASFVSLIHSVESFRLLEEINKQAIKNNRIIPCLLQIYIAKEETKFGLSQEEALEILNSSQLSELKNISITGLMGMATNTENRETIRKEFISLKKFFESIKTIKKPNVDIKELSMGMSSDYGVAVEEGSSMIRVGSAIFR